MSRPLRIALIVLVAGVVVLVLFTVVFPWVDTLVADPTMGIGTPG